MPDLFSNSVVVEYHGDSSNEDIVRSSIIRRKNPLKDGFPEEWRTEVVEKALEFIEGRFEKMQTSQTIESFRINAFLLMMMAPAYNINSPYDLAEHLQTGEMPHGDSTSFGKFVENKLFPIFGVETIPEKDDSQPADVKTLYSPLDAQMVVEDEFFYATWKAGPWTMNKAHTNEMKSCFPRIYEQTGHQIILGIFYGKYDWLNNKPAEVRRETGPYFHTLAGKDLWEFVTGYRDAHKRVLEAMREAQSVFAERHGGKTFFEHMLEYRLNLTQSIRDAYEIESGADDLWARLIEENF